MKATITFYADDSWSPTSPPVSPTGLTQSSSQSNIPHGHAHAHGQGHQQASQQELDIDTNGGMAKFFSAACDAFNINLTDRDQYTVQHEVSKQYLDGEAVFGTWTAVGSGSGAGSVRSISLILRKKPAVRAQECVNTFANNEEGAKEKDIVFQLRYALVDSHFAESFIDKGGVAALLRMVSRAKGNAQTYALHALRQCMEYVSGMTVVMGTPHLVKELFTLVDSSVVGVVRTALELLFVMCGYAKENGFVSVHRAAKGTAKEKGREPYANVVSLLEATQDLETMANAFTLLNALLSTAPSDSKSAKLCKQWEKCGLHDKLRALTDIQDQTFQVQLEIFEESTGVNLRSRASRLESQCRSLKNKLREYEQQQPLVLLLREELRRIQYFVAEAWSDGSLISSAPMKRYLGPQQAEYPVDLSFLKTAIIEKERAEGLVTANTKLSDEFTVLQNQYKQAITQLDALRAQLDTFQDSSAELEATKQQLTATKNQLAHTAEIIAQGERDKASLTKMLEEMRSQIGLLETTISSTSSENRILLDERNRLLLSMQQPTDTQPVFTSPSITPLDSSVHLGPPPLPPALGEATPSVRSEATPAASLATTPAPSETTLSAPSATTPTPSETTPLSDTMPSAPSKAAPPAVVPPPDTPVTPSPALPTQPTVSEDSTPLAVSSATIPPAASNDTPSTEGPPPPPPPGPPPPPPPVSKPAVKPNKPPVTPNSKMRPLYWKRIILPQITRPAVIWDQVAEQPFNTADLELHFAVKVADKKKEENSINVADKEAAKDKLVSVLDPKRSNAISFMLAKLPPIATVKAAISQMDDTKLNKELIRSLINNMPSQEEIQAITDTNLSPEKLDKPERFALEIVTIPRVKDVLTCWLFLQDFSETTSPFTKHFASIIDSCHLTRSSSGLRKVLGTILAVGNHLNGGSTRGQADGFNLEALESLGNTKDVSNTMTLLDHISTIIVQKNGVQFLVELEKELAPLGSAASAPALDVMKDDLTSLNNSTKKTRAVVQSVVSELGQSHSFSQTFPKQMSSCEASVDSFAASLKQAEVEFATLLEFYGYAKAATTEVSTSQVFGWVYNCIRTMAKAAEKEGARLAAAAKNKQEGEGSDKFGKKIAQGLDPLASLANAMKLGGQVALKKRPVVE